MSITVANYNDEIKAIHFDKLPEGLKKIHNDLIIKGKALDNYSKADEVKSATDKYLMLLNKVVDNTPGARKTKDRPAAKRQPSKPKPAPKKESFKPKFNAGDIVKKESGEVGKIKSLATPANDQAMAAYSVELPDRSSVYWYEDDLVKGAIEDWMDFTPISSDKKTAPKKKTNAKKTTAPKTKKTKAKANPRKSATRKVTAKAPTTAKATVGKKAKTRTSAKKSVNRKSVNRKSAVPQVKPQTVRNIKSPELGIITFFTNLAKSKNKRSVQGIANKAKQISNGFKAGKYIEHKTLITDIGMMLNKIATKMEKEGHTDVNVKFESAAAKKLVEKANKALQGASERLRVSFLAGTGKLRSVVVHYDTGDVIPTSMAAGLSDKQIRDYFRIGKSFNIGEGEYDKMAKVTKVEIKPTGKKH